MNLKDRTFLTEDGRLSAEGAAAEMANTTEQNIGIPVCGIIEVVFPGIEPMNITQRKVVNPAGELDNEPEPGQVMITLHDIIDSATKRRERFMQLGLNYSTDVLPIGIKFLSNNYITLTPIWKHERLANKLTNDEVEAIFKEVESRFDEFTSNFKNKKR